MDGMPTAVVSSVNKCLQTAMKLQEEHKQAFGGDKRAEQKLEKDYQHFVRELSSLQSAIGTLNTYSLPKEMNHLKPLIQKIESSMQQMQHPATRRSREEMMEEVIAKLFGEQLTEFVNNLYTLREDAFKRGVRVESVSKTSTDT